MFTEQVILSVILMNICVAISSIFIENTFWIYLREVLTDQQFDFVNLMIYFNTLLLAMTTEWLLEYLTPGGLFTMFSIMTLIGAIFIIVMIKEAVGLTDK